jgi:hypothetical protein
VSFLAKLKVRDLCKRELFTLDNRLEDVDGVPVKAGVSHLIVLCDEGQEKRFVLAHLPCEERRVSFDNG